MKINGIEIDGKIIVEYNGRTFVFDNEKDFVSAIRTSGTSENKTRYPLLFGLSEYQLLCDVLSRDQLDKIEIALEGMRYQKLIFGDEKLILDKYPYAKQIPAGHCWYSVCVLDTTYKPVGCEGIVYLWMIGEMDVLWFLSEMNEL